MVKYVAFKVTMKQTDEHYFSWEQIKLPEDVDKGRAVITAFNKLDDAVAAARRDIELEWHGNEQLPEEDIRLGRMYAVHSNGGFTTYYLFVKKKA